MEGRVKMTTPAHTPYTYVDAMIGCGVNPEMVQHPDGVWYFRYSVVRGPKLKTISGIPDLFLTMK
jgi:hypothetical protein